MKAITESVKLYEIKYTNVHPVPDTHFRGVVVGLRVHYETEPLWIHFHE